jgi:cytochrome c553
MTRHKTGLAGVLAALFLSPGVALAEMSPAVLAASCDNCHGPAGNSPGSIPSLNGLEASAMAARLRGFKSGEIEATVMNRIARGYTDAEIDALVRYFTTSRP